MTFVVRDAVLHRDGVPWRAVGVNYLPSSAGCRIWSDWDADAIERDFAAIAGHGLNTVRVFVFWRDVEPVEGCHDPAVLERISALVAMADRHGLACVLSVFTIWMNGEVLDPPWRAGRNPWRDADLLDRGEAYLRAVAATVRGLPNVLALDLGDEIGNLVPHPPARDEVAAWQVRMASAARETLPGVLVCQANDVSGVLRAAPFGPDNGVGLDLHAVHSWPLWTPGAVESTASEKASQLPGFLIRYACAFGPALVDELGSYGVSEPIAAGYQRAAGAAALAAGASGVFAWCWRDIASTAPPYDTRPAERAAGMTRLDGTARPALDALVDTARLAGLLADFRTDRPEVAVYLPDLVRAGGSSYLDAPVGTVATFFASLLLRRAGLPHRIVAGDDGIGPTRLVVVPSVARLTLADRTRLRAHLRAGATVYLSVADHVGGLPDGDLTGVLPEDFSLLGAGRTRLVWTDGTSWPLAPGEARHVTVRPDTAGVLARFADDAPACTVNQVGSGRFVLATFPLERQLDRPGALVSAGLHTVYRKIAALAGVRPPLAVPPEVEVVTGTRRDRPAIVLVNHGTAPATLRGSPPITVPAKGWLVTDDTGALDQAGAEPG